MGSQNQRATGVHAPVLEQTGSKIRQIASADPITKDTNTFLEAAGVPKHFTSHALRSAVGSSMKERGATDSEIMNRGRWKSVTVFR